jgi:site-specific recombinase XerD
LSKEWLPRDLEQEFQPMAEIQVARRLTDSSSMSLLKCSDGHTQSAIAPLTEQAYAYDWSRFVSWCQTHGKTSIGAHPQVIAQFLLGESMQGFAIMTVSRRLAAIGYMHRVHNAPLPRTHDEGYVIDNALAEIRSHRTRDRCRQSTTKAFQAILQSISGVSCEDVRDRAMLAMRIAGAFRRSELARLCVEHITRGSDEIRICFGRSGAHVTPRKSTIILTEGTHIRPVSLLNTWLARADIQSGAVFRQLAGNLLATGPMTETAIADVIRRRAAVAGYDYRCLGESDSPSAFVAPGSVTVSDHAVSRFETMSD